MKLIHPRFQGMVIAFGACSALLCLGLVFIAERLFFSRSYDAIAAAGLPQGHAIFYFLDQQQLLMRGAFLLAAVASLAFAVLIGLALSNRVARPLDQMKRHFESIASGKSPTRLHFRKTDLFQEVADAYNLQLERQGTLPGIDASKAEKLEKSW